MVTNPSVSTVGLAHDGPNGFSRHGLCKKQFKICQNLKGRAWRGEYIPPFEMQKNHEL